MQQLVVALLAQISAYASILGLYFSIMPPGTNRPEWHWMLIGVVGILAIISVGSEIRNYLKNRLKSYSDRQINRYMCKWVSKPGRTIIFSRDLSWGNEQQARRSLLEKAGKGELSICLFHETPLSRELAAAGARIVLYAGSHHSPKARFTIVGYGRDGSSVAIGTQKSGKHAVYEYSVGQHPAYAIAEDLAKIILGYEGVGDAF